MGRNEVPSTEEQRIRVTLELSRSDDPQLFDALVKLKKGRRRVARLRTLAHDGLLADQRRPLAAASGEASGVDGVDDVGEGVEQTDLAALAPRVTAGLFEDPLQE